METRDLTRKHNQHNQGRRQAQEEEEKEEDETYFLRQYEKEKMSIVILQENKLKIVSNKPARRKV